ncbi:MAG: hypothetical protein Hyperionvirus17_10 [Hyperionvirus sp.]|uniref:Uncharacterized protein n=1 Tax=Hyperionvirus sp. TaxID=2487770 RepID=A0A3G5AA19_9VIRU|nr:MAG: hypothetical protein Hyperionvirus17_10 [Hyperionvirus sp.]
MEQHGMNFDKRILPFENYKYNRNPPSTIGLFDKMVCYFDGFNRKVVPLKIALAYPIIYDVFMAPDSDVTFDLSIGVCPFTLAAGVFEGKYKVSDRVDRSCLVISNGSNTFPIIQGAVVDGKSGKSLKKYEVDIKLLRNVFTEFPDCKYLVPIGGELEKPVLGEDYYVGDEVLFRFERPPENVHLKTLVYLIEYESSKEEQKKSTVVVGRDASPTEVTGYNVVLSGTYDYLVNSEHKLKQKFGFVTPVLWFAWKSFYPDAKLIFIP